MGFNRCCTVALMAVTGKQPLGVVHPPKDGGSAVGGPSDDVIALRHLRAGGGECFGRLIARWSSFMHVSVYLEAESPCQFPVFQTTHLGLWLDFCFTNFLDFNCDGYYDGALSARARGFTFCVDPRF